MSLTQFSLLGRVRRGQDGYERARYLFPDGQVEETAFFGLALARRLQPDRLVVLGTTGSLWHALLDLTGLQRRQPALWNRLDVASGEDRADPADLEVASGCLSESLGCEVCLQLIPYGRSESDQLRILEILARQVGRAQQVALDVTHGLRHLPMLALLSALLLRALRSARIAGIYYGALDLTDRSSGLTPVLEVGALLGIADWSSALARFEADGDYGALAAQLATAGLPAEAVAALQKAAFHEQVCQYGHAIHELAQARRYLKRGLGGPASLFQERLAQELDRVQASNLAERQFRLAERAFQRGDLLRTVTLLKEAVVSASRRPGEPALDPEARDQAAREIRNGCRGPISWKEPFRRLSHLRNALIHGGIRPHRSPVAAWLKDRPTLLRQLQRLFDVFRPVFNSEKAGSIVNPCAKLLTAKGPTRASS